MCEQQTALCLALLGVWVSDGLLSGLLSCWQWEEPLCITCLDEPKDGEPGLLLGGGFLDLLGCETD